MAIISIFLIGLSIAWLVDECFLQVKVRCHQKKIISRGKYYFLYVFVFIVLSPALSLTMFVDLPHRSASFDCDDATLFMYKRFRQAGVPIEPIVGDLNLTGEKYEEISHIWLLVNVAGVKIPFDWGSFWLDRQHFEGYTVSYDSLQMFVQQDRQQAISLIPGN